MSEFAAALRTLRQAAGLSLDALARRAHCGKATIGHAENGIRMPGSAIVHALDRALDAGGVLISMAQASHEHRRRVRTGQRLAGPAGPSVDTGVTAFEANAAPLLIQLQIEGQDVHVVVNRRTLVAGGLGLLAGAFPGGKEIGLSRRWPPATTASP